MRNRIRSAGLMLLLVFSLTRTGWTGDKKDKEGHLKAKLVGFQEVPAISSKGTGEFTATISSDDSKIDYALSWSNLEGGNPLFAHIHFGQLSVNGGVSAFLCSSSGTSPAGTPPCPAATSGKVEGTITAASVIGPADRGIAPGEFAELLRAIRTGNAYVNIHTPTWMGGEIRAQLNTRGKGLFVLQDVSHHHDDDDDDE